VQAGIAPREARPEPYYLLGTLCQAAAITMLPPWHSAAHVTRMCRSCPALLGQPAFRAAAAERAAACLNRRRDYSRARSDEPSFSRRRTDALPLRTSRRAQGAERGSKADYALSEPHDPRSEFACSWRGIGHLRELLVSAKYDAGSQFKVSAARRREEAVALASSLRPDVITMDLHLPGLDGIGATHAIIRHATPIVVVSTTSKDSAMPGLRALGEPGR